MFRDSRWATGTRRFEAIRNVGCHSPTDSATCFVQYLPTVRGRVAPAVCSNAPLSLGEWHPTFRSNRLVVSGATRPPTVPPAVCSNPHCQCYSREAFNLYEFTRHFCMIVVQRDRQTDRHTDACVLHVYSALCWCFVSCHIRHVCLSVCLSLMPVQLRDACRSNASHLLLMYSCGSIVVYRVAGTRSATDVLFVASTQLHDYRLVGR